MENFSNERDYKKPSNHCKLFWPLTSSRPSDVPGSKERKKRHGTSELSKNGTINPVFSCTDDAKEVKKRLFTDDTSSYSLAKSPTSSLGEDISESTTNSFKVAEICNNEQEDNTIEGCTSSDKSIEIPNKCLTHHPLKNQTELRAAGFSHKCMNMMLTPMEDSFITLLKTISHENNWNSVVYFISMAPLQMPPTEIVQTLLYNIIMESTDSEIFTKASLYVKQLLNLFPPSSKSIREYYHKILFEREKKSTDWDIILSIIRCCIKKCGLSSEQQCGKNCHLVLKFMVEVIKRDYDESKMPRSCTPEKREPRDKTLLVKLFWPSGNANGSSYNCHTLIKFIDQIFSVKVNELELQVLECLTTLLCLVTECARETHCSEIEAMYSMNCTPLAEIQQVICHCDNIVNHKDNLELFLSHINLTWLQMAICESVLNQTVYNAWCSNVRSAPLLLRKIISCYMFPAMQLSSSSKEPIFPELVQYVPTKIRRCEKGKTQLHHACATDHFGTLGEFLSDPSVDASVTDAIGWTLLHEASYSNSHLCTKVLLDIMRSKDSRFVPDIFAVDTTLHTCLHIAVVKNFPEIAELLLSYGGSRLAYIKNDKGLTAIDMIRSEEMKFVFKQYIRTSTHKIKPQHTKRIEPSIQKLLMNKTTPSMSDLSMCEMYIFCLQSLLFHYLKFYDLLGLFRKYKDTLGKVDLHTFVKNHLHECVKFKTSIHDIVNLCDDLLMLENVSSIVQSFSDHMRNTSMPFHTDISQLLVGFQFLKSLL